jgi:hypothetical protein
MGDVAEFNDEKYESHRMRETIENLKYLISKVSDAHKKAFFRDQLEEYEVRLAKFEQKFEPGEKPSSK